MMTVADNPISRADQIESGWDLDDYSDIVIESHWEVHLFGEFFSNGFTSEENAEEWAKRIFDEGDLEYVSIVKTT